MKTVITARMEDNEIELLRKGADIDKRSVSSFLRKAGLTMAEEVIKKGDMNGN